MTLADQTANGPVARIGRTTSPASTRSSYSGKLTQRLGKEPLHPAARMSGPFRWNNQSDVGLIVPDLVEPQVRRLAKMELRGGPHA